MKKDIKKRRKSNIKIKKINFVKNKQIKSIEELLEIHFVSFFEVYDKLVDNNLTEISEKDMKIMIDSSIVSLFGTFEASKISYSIKEIKKPTKTISLFSEEVSSISENKFYKEKFFTLVMKKWY